MGWCVYLRIAIKGRQDSLNIFGLTLPRRGEGRLSLDPVISIQDPIGPLSRATEDSVLGIIVLLWSYWKWTICLWGTVLCILANTAIWTYFCLASCKDNFSLITLLGVCYKAYNKGLISSASLNFSWLHVGFIWIQHHLLCVIKIFD